MKNKSQGDIYKLKNDQEVVFNVCIYIQKKEATQ